jgi:hypothetical protein
MTWTLHRGSARAYGRDFTTVISGPDADRARIEVVPASEADKAYAERNAVVLAFAHLGELMGWTVGKLSDPDEPDWPVLMIDTPAGQVSWHLTADEMPATMPKYPGEWDGHSTPEKYERLRRLAGMAWGEGRLVSDEAERP